MKPQFVLALAMLPLAACSGGAANNSHSAPNVAAAVAAQPNLTMSGTATVEGDLTMQPGQWEVRGTLDEMNMPGAPPAAIDQMKQMMAARVERICFTPEDVANMGRRMFETTSDGTNCQFTNQVFGGGRVDIAGSCQTPQATVQMTMQGSYTATTMQTRNVMDTTVDGQTMRMVMTSSGQRVGDCPAAGAENTAQPGE